MDSKKRNKCGKRKASAMYAKISEVQDLREKQWRELHKRGPFPKKLQAVKHATEVSLKSVMLRRGEVYPRRVPKILFSFGDEYDSILKQESENLEEIVWKYFYEISRIDSTENLNDLMNTDSLPGPSCSRSESSSSVSDNSVSEDQVECNHYCNSESSSSGISNNATAIQKTNDKKSSDTYPNIKNIMNQKLYTDDIEGSSSSDYEDDVDGDGDDIYKTDNEPSETGIVESPMILPGPSCSYTQPNSSSHTCSKSFQDPAKAMAREKRRRKKEKNCSQFWNGAWMKDFLKSGYKRIKEKQENPPKEFDVRAYYRNRRGNDPIIVFPDEKPVTGNQAKIDLENAVGFERFVLQDLPYLSDYELSGEDEIAKLCENDDIFKDPYDEVEEAPKAVSDPEHMKELEKMKSESKKMKSVPAKPSLLKVTKSEGGESSSTSTTSNLKSKETKGKACTSIKMSATSTSKQKFKLTKQKASTAITSSSIPKSECNQNEQKSSEDVKIYKCFRANASFIPKHPKKEPTKSDGENSSLTSTSSKQEYIKTGCKGRKYKAKEPSMIKEKPKKPKRKASKSSKEKNISYSDDKSKIKKRSSKK